MDQPEKHVPEIATPSTPNPDQDATTLSGWFKENYAQLLFVGVIAAMLVYFKVNIFDVMKAALGLGLVIFIHELGHFLAAKFCDVHVQTFSIGFGKPLPFCSFRYGETSYKLGWIPLGGYVKMVGEGENADTEEAEEDPRSFKNKAVWQRMLIISAGVIMNVLLGSACFMYAYSHGVEETPAIVGFVGIGSPAWQEDVRANSQIIQIADIQKPTFDDVKPEVMSASAEDTIPFVFTDKNGKQSTVQLKPRKNPDDLYPMVGISPVDQLVLLKAINGAPVVRAGTPAAKADKFQPKDRIIGTTDPDNPSEVTLLPKDPRDITNTKYDTFEFLKRQHRLRGKPMIVRIERDGSTIDVPLEAAWTRTLPGARLQMGRIAALRKNSPAATATLVGSEGEASLKHGNPIDSSTGDRMIAVEITVDGKKRRYVEELSKDKPNDVEEVVLDAMRLPHELQTWAEKASDLTVLVTVLRETAPNEKAGKKATFRMTWDRELAFNGEGPSGPSAPTAISGLGLAYYVNAAFDHVTPGSDAAKMGLQQGDVIAAVRINNRDDKGETKKGDWFALQSSQGVYVHQMMQRLPTDDFDLKVKRATPEGEQEIELNVTCKADETWPTDDRGFVFSYDSRLQKAENVWEALGMGMHRTWRTVRVIYQTLYATVFRQISVKTMSGPLTIANVSYKVAGYDIWQFIIFIGLININLAVVNFLPIPVLDGGHMVFLIYEKIRGKPAPDRVIEAATWVGLGLILLLMVFVISLDVRRLFF